ncbi:MAG: hypothetical protein ACRDST_09445 [Pseudonocardiaceae bacterium]
MTTSQETMTDTARRGQEAITSAMQIWLDNLHWLAPDSDTKLRGAVEAVDKMYDFADHMLITQREFTKSWLAAYASFATNAAYVAQDAAKGVEYAAKDMQDSANSQRQMDRRPTKDADTAPKKS